MSKKYSGFNSGNTDQFLGYEAGQFDGASKAFDTIANWIEEDLRLGIFDANKYIETLREHANEPFVSVGKVIKSVADGATRREG
jgi:hypothetical protein